MWFLSVLKKVFPAVLALMLLAGCSSDADTASTGGEGTIVTADMLISRETTYRTAEVTQGELIRTASTSVESVYTQKIQLNTGAKELALVEITVKRGDAVREGDVLATLMGMGKASDAEQIRLDLAYARATYLETCAIREEGITQAENGNYTSEEIRSLTIEKLQAAYDLYRLSTQVNIGALEERLADAEAALGETFIYAPCDGFVRSVANYSTGDIVPAGTGLITINNGDSLVLFTDTTSVDVFSYNTSVALTWESGDELMRGTGRVVCSADVLPGCVGQYIYILQDSPEELSPGANPMAEAAQILLSDAVIVPRSALSMDEGRVFVTVLDGNSTKKRYVVRGPMAGTDVALLQGVLPGDIVITSQYTS